MASCSTSSIQDFKYDVFLSFRGEDVRKNFIDHLYYALEDRGIITYKDDVTLKIGNEISSTLLQAIEESKIYIIVFSKTYASSGWCLNELVKIMECDKMIEHTTYPVFYDVEPTDIRHQTRDVGEAFANHEGDANVGRWREALTEAANLSGHFLKNVDDGHEGRFVRRIAEHILKLHPIKMYIDKPIVGMERRMEAVLSSIERDIDEVRMIGISGIGGGGKTTLAKAVFNKISTRFEGISFVENVREVSKMSGLQSLQKQIILDVSKGKEMVIHSVGHGKNMLMSILRGKKVLIVLDDVGHNDQLVALIGEPNWYKAGSRIIIAARNRQVLIPYVVMPIHEVDLLSDEEAKGLFNSFAFKGGIPTQGYQELSEEAVHSAGGLPLYIRALGRFLCGKDMLEWREQLERLKSIPLEDSNKILELSYVDLVKDFQDVFLDVACFLKGSHKEEAVRILQICGLPGRIGLRDLEQRSLIRFSGDQHIDMHDHIQGMGRYIVQRKYPDDPKKHSRLWEREKIEEILNNEWVSEETKAIGLDECLTSDTVAKGFGNIKHLKFLRMISKRDENTHHVSRNLPSTLRYLSWEFYPDWSLPRKFQPNNLVALEMYGCKIKRLWEGEEKKVLEKLKFLLLSHSELTFLDLDLTPNLEKLDLEECHYLENIQMGELCLQKLVSLNLTGCSSINSLSFIRRLKSLEILHLSNLSLEEFPDIISIPDNMSLLELHFRDNDIIELPSSIGNLKNLLVLDFHRCRKLRSLPRSICGLQDLKVLDLHCCTLSELPEDIDHLKCLENLDLSHAHIKHLPDRISMLPKLTTLNLSYCWYLEKLPEDLDRLDSLEKLVLTECTQIRKIPDSTCQLKNLKYLSLLNCVELKDLPEGLELLECLKELYVKGTCIELPRGLLSLRNLKTDQALSSSEASSSIKRQKIYHI